MIFLIHETFENKLKNKNNITNIVELKNMYPIFGKLFRQNIKYLSFILAKILKRPKPKVFLFGTNQHSFLDLGLTHFEKVTGLNIHFFKATDNNVFVRYNSINL